MSADVMEELRGALSAQAAMVSELVSSFLEGPLEAAGLGLGSFELLSAVKAGEGTASQAEIADRMGIRPASLCEALRTMTSRGLVVRQSNPGDKRSNRLRLSAKGERLYQKCLEAIAKAEKILRDGIADRDLKVAGKVLSRAAANLSQAIGE